MSNCKTYSAHPALALEQLQCAELFKNQQNETHLQPRRQNSSGNLFDSSNKTFSRKLSMPIMREQHLEPPHEILPDRTVEKNSEYVDDVEDVDEGSDNYAVIDEDEMTTTKDFINCANNYNDIDDDDEPDCRTITKSKMTTNHEEIIQNSKSQYRVSFNCHHLSQLQHNLALGDIDTDGGSVVERRYCLSGVSSTVSSPSASTVSTPLSTPTRLPHTTNHDHQEQLHHNQHYHNHHQVHNCNQHCCQYKQKQINNSKEQKPISGFVGNFLRGGAAVTDISVTTQTISKSMLETKNQQHPHYHHQQLNFNHNTSSSSSSSTSSPINKNNNGNKKIKKCDPRLGPSPYRQLLPIALCILSFAVVFSLLIIYMDTTEIRHQQFRLNMSRDYDMYGVGQDDPQLIAFLREIHMRKYPMHFLKSRANDGITTTTITTQTSNENNNFAQQRFNFNAIHDKSDLAPLMARYVSNLVGNKLNSGSVIQSLPGSLSHLLTAPWLAETLNWAGLIVEPEPRRFFALRKQNQQSGGMQVLHACVSPTAYPKEVTLHNEDTDVRINSLLDEETSWFNSRVKCFPLYTIMLACNRTQYDLLSLGVHGHELEILQTLPFEKVQIEVISIHLPDDHEDARNGQNSQEYIEAITHFLILKNYKIQRQFGRNYFYQRQHFISNRTRKKDILLLKTP